MKVLVATVATTATATSTGTPGGVNGTRASASAAAISAAATAGAQFLHQQGEVEGREDHVQLPTLHVPHYAPDYRAADPQNHLRDGCPDHELPVEAPTTPAGHGQEASTTAWPSRV
jgi:hypothetical protein